jgi:hypothetical protein
VDKPETKMNRFAVTLLVSLLAMFAVVPVWAGEAQPTDERSHIDLVIALDTSNSMDGLIDSVRQKMWDLVSEMATAKPTPILRVGIVSFGNDGYQESGWTRVDQDLTTDLDAVFEKLMGLRTNGGTEYVGRAIHVARTEIDWSKDRKALKLLFVAGNESADQDSEFPALEEAGKIIAADIVVNTIYCGQQNDVVALSWQKVAARADGKFAAISADGGAIVVATPLDDEILKLNDKLNGTYIAYGRGGAERKVRQKAADDSAAKLSKPAAVARSGAKATRLYNNRDWDLVDAAEEEGFALDELAPAELPKEMRGMSAKERVAYVSKKAAERRKLQKKLISLNKKRQAYIKVEIEKKGDAKNQAFDAVLIDALREQAAEKDIVFE